MNDAVAGAIRLFFAGVVIASCGGQRPAVDKSQTAAALAVGQTNNPAGACNGAETGADDGNPCTVDSCDASGNVTHTLVADGIACNDGNACTLGETCQQGVCNMGPGTTCVVGNSVTLYQSFENGSTLDIIAGGSKTPQQGPVPIVEAPGLFGKGIDGSTTTNIFYTDPTGTSLNLAKPGSLSLWFKNEANTGAEPLAFLAIDAHANIKMGISGGPASVNLWFQFSDGTNGGAWTETSAAGTPGMSDLATGQWHLLVVNWSFDVIAVSVDGGPPAATAVSWLAGNHVFGPNTGALIEVSGSAGVPGQFYPGAGDEVIVMNRPMTTAEIQWYWAQRFSGGPGVVNPAVAHFNATPTACNQWDDLNPCTTDACPTPAGATHVPLASGTPCSDGNVCNGGESCDVLGQCVAGPMPNLDDGNICTDDQCSYATGVVHAPIDNGGLCAAGNPTVVPRADGVVDIGGGKRVAVFGYDSTALASVSIPLAVGQNAVTLNGAPVAHPVPDPPVAFLPGPHPGIWLPALGPSDTLTWTVAGATVSASGSQTPLTHVPIGTSGYGVMVGDTLVPIQPDLAAYEAPPPPVKLPDQLPITGPPFNGTIPASLTVSSIGAAVYTVPIAIPPGIGGMAPDLSLVYNSQGADGIAGQGWDLGGLSAIQRCPRTRAQDGLASPVQMSVLAGPGGSEDDPATTSVCLDGKRLFFRESLGSGYVYESEAQDRVFLDGTWLGGTFSFQTRTGETRYYGMRQSSRVRFPENQGFEGDESVTAVWALDRVVDQWGNYFDIEYNDGIDGDALNRGLLVTKIDYTGHLPTADGAQSDNGAEPFNSIRFTYEPTPRVDVRNIRFGTHVLARNRRLTGIDVGTGVYSLTYAPDDVMLPSRLATVSYCTDPGNPATCAEPLQFGWDAGDYSWSQRSDYKLPADISTPTDQNGNPLASGNQLVDLDGDGRLDFISAKIGSPTKVWRNTGEKFEEAPAGWILPDQTALVNADGTLTGGAFADFDGDGLVDFIFAPGGEDRTCRGWPSTFCEGGFYRPAFVYLNRLTDPTSGTWVRSSTFETLPDSWAFVDVLRRDVAVDINGDGLADIVRMHEPTNFSAPMKVLLNGGPGVGWRDSGTTYSHDTQRYHLVDINRDGLLDLVAPPDPDSRIFGVAINTGATIGNVWRSGTQTTDYASYYANNSDLYSGDFDGDGLPDSLLHSGYGFLDGVAIGTAFSVGIGHIAGITLRHLDDTGANQITSSTGGPLNQAYQTSLGEMLQPWHFMSHIVAPIATVDINADGLTDVVQDHGSADSGHGQVIVNTGDRFQDLNGLPAWRDSAGTRPVPLVPRAGGPSVFIDLDGDGVVDLANNKTAWLNQFRPAIITTFPAGVALPSTASYVSLTSAAASGTYSDTGGVAKDTLRVAPSLRVVASIAADDGTGGIATTKYEYSNLRVGVAGRGPLQFATSIVTDPSGNSVRTFYSQVFPYGGLPTRVDHRVPGAAAGSSTIASMTITTYCDAPVSSPTENPTCTPMSGAATAAVPRATRKVYPLQVWDTVSQLVASGPYLVDSGKLQSTTTDFRNDDRGNNLRTTVTTTGLQGDQYRSETISSFEIPASPDQTAGRPLQVVNTTQRLDDGSGQSAHTTTFEYADVMTVYTPFSEPVRALVKKRIEPNAGPGLELHEVFKYDRFGNVITTTSCATDFDGCAVGAPGPTVSEDGSHLPYRTVTVSYSPGDFNAPAGLPVTVLPYREEGRFPVVTTNAAGHREYTAYDPRFGTVIQRTAPNGIHSCRMLDGFGRPQTIIERCGSTEPLTTSIQRAWSNPGIDPAYFGTVVSTWLPTGQRTWDYADVLGRPVQSITYGFDNSLSATRTEYDPIGRVHRTSKPALGGDPVYWRTMTYDQMGRVTQVLEDLAPIDGSSTPAFSVVTNTYEALQTTITKSVAGETRIRTEVRNGRGKLASVTEGVDADQGTITYTYDADGNLRTTTDSSQNVVLAETDKRGRRWHLNDPDLGDQIYTYDSFGDVLWQTDANRKTTFTYDGLGRMLSRTDDTGTSTWLYDTADAATGRGIGKLAAMVSADAAPDPRISGSCVTPYGDLLPTDGAHAARWFEYDDLGQQSDAFDCVGGETFQTSFTYDTGRQKTVQYPAIHGERFVAEYNYAPSGYLHYVSSPSDGKVIWAATALDASGHVVTEYTRNGVETVSTLNPSTGWVMGSTSTAHGIDDTVIQAWQYRYDEAGNLRGRQRSDALDGGPVVEAFGYDSLERLTSSDVTISPGGSHIVEQYQFDPIGNLTWKGDQHYTYGTCGAGPHAVCQIANNPGLSYDAHGNLKTSANRTVAFNPANRVTHIESAPSGPQATDGAAVDFIYGADGGRVLQLATGGGSSDPARTVYVGLGPTGKSFYERTQRASGIEHTQFVYAGSAHGGNAVALRVQSDDASGNAESMSLRFNHFDHLGSVTAISDDVGRVATTMGYDAWGARRNSDGTPAAASSFELPVGHRGFTGQESIPNLGLINLNGRIYDPAIGRMLSPDPTVPSVADLQSYNRYSYVFNNPLRSADPTGFGGPDPNPFHHLWFNVGAAGVVVAPYACAGVGAGLVLTRTSVDIGDGEPVVPTLAVAAVSLATAYAGGVAGDALAAGGGDTPGTAILVGAISGTVSSALTDVATSRGDLGQDILKGAATGAAFAAVSYVGKTHNPVSEADVAVDNGGAERGDTLESVLIEGGFGHRVNDLDWYIATGYGGDRIVAEADQLDFGQMAGCNMSPCEIVESPMPVALKSPYRQWAEPLQRGPVVTGGVGVSAAYHAFTYGNQAGVMFISDTRGGLGIALSAAARVGPGLGAGISVDFGAYSGSILDQQGAWAGGNVDGFVMSTSMTHTVGSNAPGIGATYGVGTPTIFDATAVAGGTGVFVLVPPRP